jgi:hypothetical protein
MNFVQSALLCRLNFTSNICLWRFGQLDSVRCALTANCASLQSDQCQRTTNKSCESLHTGTPKSRTFENNSLLSPHRLCAATVPLVCSHCRAKITVRRAHQQANLFPKQLQLATRVTFRVSECFVIQSSSTRTSDIIWCRARVSHTSSVALLNNRFTCILAFFVSSPCYPSPPPLSCIVLTTVCRLR